jgi:hypothetical protein
MGVTAQSPTAAPPPQHVPSVRTLAKASALALGVAAVLLATVVFPAEYGIDPLGTGRALGLSALGGTTTAGAPVPPPTGTKVVPVQEGPVALYPAGFKVDSRELVLGPYEYVEFKYHLEQGATLLFSWKASGDVMHDFHGDHDGEAGGDSPQSYDTNPRRQADGSFVAPFAGIHGWFWENPGGDTITIHLTTAGFYTSAHQFRFDRTRVEREVRALDTITPITDKEQQ